jgi:hypothetical protein
MAAQPNTSEPASESESVVALLHAIEARLARMEERLDTLERRTNIHQVEPLAATTIDIVDGWIRKAQAQGVDIDERGREVLRLVERSTRPQTLRGLEAALDQVDALPMLIATIVDTLDGFIARQVERGVDPVELTRNIGTSLDRFARFVQSDTFDSLVESGVFDPEAVEVVALAGEAMASERHEGSEPVGTFGLFGAMRDPDVQRSLGFGIGFARRLGRSLKNQKQIEG